MIIMTSHSKKKYDPIPKMELMRITKEISEELGIDEKFTYDFMDSLLRVIKGKVESRIDFKISNFGSFLFSVNREDEKRLVNNRKCRKYQRKKMANKIGISVEELNKILKKKKAKKAKKNKC